MKMMIKTVMQDISGIVCVYYKVQGKCKKIPLVKVIMQNFNIQMFEAYWI